eukprot:6182147-Pyramimonas_sp.AAC.1
MANDAYTRRHRSPFLLLARGGACPASLFVFLHGSRPGANHAEGVHQQPALLQFGPPTPDPHDPPHFYTITTRTTVEPAASVFPDLRNLQDPPCRPAASSSLPPQ